MKILICDDHELFRQGLAQALTQIDSDVELLHAVDGAEALRLAESHEDLDLALIDFRLPDIDGLVVLETLRERCPTIPVVMISAFDDPELIRSALDSGAAGFVPKSSRSAVILGAVRLVLAGDIYVPRRALDAPAAPSEPAQAPPETRRRRATGLTPRQLEVAQLIAKGLTNREICGVLGIAEGTVKAHVTAILEGLDVSNRTEAVMALAELDLDE